MTGLKRHFYTKKLYLKTFINKIIFPNYFSLSRNSALFKEDEMKILFTTLALISFQQFADAGGSKNFFKNIFFKCNNIKIN